jgi:peptidylprolyl isomerase
MGLVMMTTLSLGAAAAGAADAALDPANTLLLTLKDGVVVIELRPDLAPQHVARIKELTRAGFYDGLPFHRVIEGFMAQTGDPKGNGTGGSGVKLPAEFSRQPFVRGTVGMARSQDPNSGDSQFFICFAPAPFLDGQYTVWGQVRQGMEFVDKIKRGDERRNGEVSGPDRIIRMQLASDGDVKP